MRILLPLIRAVTTVGWWLAASIRRLFVFIVGCVIIILRGRCELIKLDDGADARIRVLMDDAKAAGTKLNVLVYTYNGGQDAYYLVYP